MSQTHLTFLVFGLLRACPFGAADENCPLRSFRRGDCLEEKLVLAEQLSQPELEQILARHQTCWAERWHKKAYGPSIHKLIRSIRSTEPNHLRQAEQPA